MPVTADALRLLHRLHRQLADVRSRLDRGPKQVSSAQARVTSAAKIVEQARETLMRTKATSDEKQLQLRTNEDRIADIKRKLNACSSNREYQAFVEQIAAADMANSVLSDEIIESLDRVDQGEEQIRQSREAVEKGKKDFEEVSSRVDDEREMLDSELARLLGELKEAESDFPSDFRRDYERIVTARGEEAIVPMEGESCGGCFQTQTPQTMNLLNMGRPVFCKSCGVLLYIPE